MNNTSEKINTVEILNGLNIGSIIELDIEKAAKALIYDWIIINNDEYVETSRTYFTDDVVIHYEYQDKYKYPGMTTKIRACININSLIDYSKDTYTKELTDRLLAKSFDKIGIPRKRIAEYLDIKQSTLSYILNKSIFRQKERK